MTTAQDSPRLVDVEHALGEWIGSIIPGVDAALAEIGDGDWSPGTRDAVLRWASREMISKFERGDANYATSPEQLDDESRLHLGRYVIARARAHVFRQNGA